MRTHLDAIMALAPADIQAFDTNVPGTPPQRYVVFFAPAFREMSLTLAYAPDVDDYFKVMSVGSSPRQVRAVQEAIVAALHRMSPNVPGCRTRVTRRASGAVDSTSDVTAERQIRPNVFHATDLYRYRATPA